MPEAPSFGNKRFARGETIMLREVLNGRVRSVRPLRVVADRDDLFAGFLVPDSKVAWPRLADGEQSQTPDQGWLLGDERWFGPGSLYLIEPGEAYAAVLFFDRDTREPEGWKIDFFEPVRRTSIGFDTLDHALDLLADVETMHVEVKDREDFGQLRRTGQLEDDAIATVLAAQDRATDKMARRVAPFDGQWTAWRPESTWQPLELTDGWNEFGLDAGAANDAQFHSAGVTAEPRSAAGGVVLDELGRVLIDFDLSNGRQVLGHAHPGVVEAIGRQLPLGWPTAQHRPGEARLRDRLSAWASRPAAADDIHFTADGPTARSVAEAWLGASGSVLVVNPMALFDRTDTQRSTAVIVESVQAEIATTRAAGGTILLDWRAVAVAPDGPWAEVDPDAIVVGETLAAGFGFGAIIAPSGRRRTSIEQSGAAIDFGRNPLGIVAALEVLGQLDTETCDRIASMTALAVQLCESAGLRVDVFGNRFRILVDRPSGSSTDGLTGLDHRRELLADRGVHVGSTSWLTIGSQTTPETLKRLVEAIPQRVNEITRNH